MNLAIKNIGHSFKTDNEGAKKIQRLMDSKHYPNNKSQVINMLIDDAEEKLRTKQICGLRLDENTTNFDFYSRQTLIQNYR
jgi:hypothetical protein